LDDGCFFFLFGHQHHRIEGKLLTV